MTLPSLPTCGAGEDGSLGFRFRQSFRLLPGVRLNLSKSGISASIGRSGATINIGKRGVRGTVGIPGSGLSYSQSLLSTNASVTGEEAPKTSRTGCLVALGLIGLLIAMARFDQPVSSETSGNGGNVAPAGSEIAPPPAKDISRVTAATLNCRARPRLASPVKARLHRNEKLNIIARTPQWAKVRSSGTACWVAAQYLEST